MVVVMVMTVVWKEGDAADNGDDDGDDDGDEDDGDKSGGWWW